MPALTPRSKANLRRIAFLRNRQDAIDAPAASRWVERQGKKRERISEIIWLCYIQRQFRVPQQRSPTGEKRKFPTGAGERERGLSQSRDCRTQSQRQDATGRASIELSAGSPKLKRINPHN
ncbi:hypothetical protein [Kamptonema formosum]|uniref:hypothetical protein n=1 Tax=Kamptonema formosum TaxID=331992 RepID=UPI0003662EBA|nr:hypothetical protein [Oscillatoria sp. PCC 10802]